LNSVPESTPERRKAEEAFHSFLESGSANDVTAREAFLNQHSQQLRPHLEDLLRDYDFLRRELPQSPDQSWQGRVLGDYQLVREVGRGGMGVVFEASDPSLNRVVALKLLSASVDVSSQDLERFRREAEAGARLSHSNIIQVYALGQADGRSFIAQEWVPGGSTLADSLAQMRDQVDLPEGYYRDTAKRFVKISRALQYAHDAGVIHRDVKPGNILMTEEGEPKLADFGLAKLHGDVSLSKTGHIVGTPYYMSPEQATARILEVDHRTDIFSLGATLYEALTLVRPFHGDTGQQVVQQILMVDPPRPDQVRSKVPVDLSVICLKAMEKNPDYRYSTMAELADDLQRFLDGQPILAQSPRWLRRAVKWARRNPLLSGGGSIAAVAFVIVTLSWVQVRDALDEAEQARKEARREAATTAATADFLIDLLEQADPSQTPGQEVTVRQILTQGSQRILAELVEEPRVRGRLLTTIGKTFFSLGLYAEALEQLEKAVELQRDLADGSSLDLAVALNALANVHAFQDRLQEAEPLYREAHQIFLQEYGPDHDVVLVNSGNLGTLFLHMRRYEDAEPLLIQTLEATRRMYGEESSHTLAGIGNLAFLYLRQGRLDEAERLTLEKVELAQRAVGKDHPESLAARHAWASLLIRQGEREKAAELLEALVGDCRRVLEAEHPKTLNSLSLLAGLRRDLGQLEAAESAFREVLEGRRKRLGPDSSRALQTAYNLSHVLILQNRHAEAVPLVREVLEKTDPANPSYPVRSRLLERALAGPAKGK